MDYLMITSSGVSDNRGNQLIPNQPLGLRSMMGRAVEGRSSLAGVFCAEAEEADALYVDDRHTINELLSALDMILSGSEIADDPRRINLGDLPSPLHIVCEERRSSLSSPK